MKSVLYEVRFDRQRLACRLPERDRDKAIRSMMKVLEAYVEENLKESHEDDFGRFVQQDDARSDAW